MTIRTTALLAALGGAAAAASAGPVFLAFTNNTLHRIEVGVSHETFTMSDSMMSLAMRDDGALVGHSPRAAGENLWQSYQLVDPLGAAPSLSLLSDNIQGPRGTLSFVGSQGYAVGDVDELKTVDYNTLEQTGVVGTMGLPVDSNGSGYDADNDVLYLINGTNDALYSVNYGDASTTFIGNLGANYLFGGAEFFDGTLYALLQDTGRQTFVIGSIDTSNGAFTFLETVGSYDPNDDTFASLAVVPAPAALSVLALGGLFARRRR